MALDKILTKKIWKDISVSLFIYALPVVALFAYFAIKGQTPWVNNTHEPANVDVPAVFKFLEGRLTLTELMPGATLDEVRAKTAITNFEYKPGG